jgi:hypothetical protein
VNPSPQELVADARRRINGNGRHLDPADEYAAWGLGEPDATPKSSPLTARALLAEHPALRPVVVDGLLREGETMNIIGSSKLGKSMLVSSLFLSATTGAPWLVRNVAQRDVLHFDNELHAQTLAFRIRQVASAMGLTLDDFGDRLRIESLRGRLRDIYWLKSYCEQLDRHPGLIVLDSGYRFMPEGFDENDNAQMCQVFNLIDSIADTTGAAVALIHHTSKGLQADKSITDVGAGAGAMSRAADTHLILRPHEEPDCWVVEAATRSFKRLEPFVIRFAWPLYHLAPDLDPAALKRPAKRDSGKRPAPEYTTESFVAAFVGETAKTEDQIVVAAEAVKLSGRKATRLLKAGIEEGLVYPWHFGPNVKVRYATIEQPVTAPAPGGSRAK